MTSGPGGPIDLENEYLGQGRSCSWYGPFQSGVSRPSIQVPFGDWESEYLYPELRYFYSDFRMTPEGAINGLITEAAGLEDVQNWESVGFFTFDPREGAGSIFSTGHYVPVQDENDEWVYPTLGPVSPNGTRRILKGPDFRKVLNETGGLASQLPYLEPEAGLSSVEWHALNDGGNAVGIAQPGNVKVAFHSTGQVFEEIISPQDWGSDPWAVSGTLANDNTMMVTRTTEDSPGVQKQLYYLLDIGTFEFIPIPRAGLAANEPVASHAAGGRVLGSGRKPWQVMNGSTVLIEALEVFTGPTGSSSQKIRELGWKSFSPVHIAPDGKITGDATLADGSRVVAQFLPVTDADEDGLPDDWEAYHARMLLDTAEIEDEEIKAVLRSGNLDPETDYLGAGMPIGTSYLMDNATAESGADDVSLAVQGRGAMEGVFRIEGVSEGTSAWWAAPEPSYLWSQFYGIGDAADLVSADYQGGASKLLGSLEGLVSWNDIPIVPSWNEEFNLYSQRSESASHWDSIMAEARVSLISTAPVSSNITRRFLEIRTTEELGSNADPVSEVPQNGVHAFTIPRGATRSVEARTIQGDPSNGSAEHLTLEPIEADLEVTTRDLAVTSVEAPATHRKISLFATPVKDGKPSEAPETDTPEEEIYVDAYDRSLAFSTSLAWIPQGSSELPLGVTLRYNPTSIPYTRTQVIDPVTKRLRGFQEALGGGSGLFGTGFSSNLSAGLEMDSELTTYTDTSQGYKELRSRVSRYKIDVTDSDGVPHRFASLDLNSFSKEAGPVSAMPAQTTTLAWEDSTRTHLVLTHKNGKKCIYRWKSGPVNVPPLGANPGQGNGLTRAELSQYTLGGACRVGTGCRSLWQQAFLCPRRQPA